ncbi:hypothetical protein G6F22_016428 [Rhizopus arrhizus]|nr:hypothetical protein G6F22_016428 [Rhizopus arrhizus]
MRELQRPSRRRPLWTAGSDSSIEPRVGVWAWFSAATHLPEVRDNRHRHRPTLDLRMCMDETGSTPAEMPLPQAWQQDLAGARFERQSIGVSRADVARVHRPGQADAFLKSEVIDAFSELGDEIARLRWLQAQGQPAPTVMATAEEAGRRWLLMSALPGRDLATSADLPPQQVVAVLADALRDLHALPVAACTRRSRCGRRRRLRRRTPGPERATGLCRALREPAGARRPGGLPWRCLPAQPDGGRRPLQRFHRLRTIGRGRPLPGPGLGRAQPRAQFW